MSYLFGADMATERADTWRRAVALGDERPGDTGPYARAPGGDSRGDATADRPDERHRRALRTRRCGRQMDDAMDSGDDDHAHDRARCDDRLGDRARCRPCGASSTCAR